MKESKAPIDLQSLNILSINLRARLLLLASNLVVVFNILGALACTSRKKSRDFSCLDMFHFHSTVRIDHKLDGLSRMEMEFILGLPPQTAYDVLTNQDNKSYSREKNDRPLLKAVSRIVTSEKDEGEGHRPIVKVEKELSWKFLFLSGTLPIRLIVLEEPKKLYVDYLKDGKGIRTMETFEGRYTVEPVYVDAERLCKHMKPKSPEEYRRCSGGKGLIASKVKVDQTFRPASPWDLPLLSSYMRRFTIETTKKVAEDLQIRAADIRGI
ncbi:hypothetical protein F2Q68_00014027 [Brassica cretica]|uniref:DUF220 domain-containing protein n=1 Tax=Brassica cretica TaxID=69181 RepID=A0A8S9HEQ1_BRACR|nr:hypothetical protein F2Q68_00014027 [Brassica cretica]